MAEKETVTLRSELKKANANSVELSKTILVLKRQHGALKQQLTDVLQDTEILEQHYRRLQERYALLEKVSVCSLHPDMMVNGRSILLQNQILGS